MPKLRYYYAFLILFALSLSPGALAGLIGKGSFGCVFDDLEKLECPAESPGDKPKLRSDVAYAVKLSNSTSKDAKELEISKLLSEAEADENLEFNTYFLGVEGRCPIKDENPIIKNAVSRCNTAKQIINNKKGIIITFIPLIKNALEYDEVSWAELDEKSILQIWYHLFEGLKLMRKTNILHMDIKSDNILFDPNNLLQPKFIDFNLSEYADHWKGHAKEHDLLTTDVTQLIHLISDNKLLKTPVYNQAYQRIAAPAGKLLSETENGETDYSLSSVIDSLYKAINE